jgi:hypothetical protein
MFITLGTYQYKIPKNTKVDLSDGTSKLAIDITIDDDVCDKWIRKAQKYINTSI